MSTVSGIEARARTFNLRRRTRTWGFWLVLGVVALIASIALLWPARYEGLKFDPENPGRDGHRALAQVLQRQGVSIRVVRSTQALAQLGDPSAPTTLVVTAKYYVSGPIQDLISRYEHVVMLGANNLPPEVLEETVGPLVFVGNLKPQPLQAGCSSEIVGQTRDIVVAERTFDGFSVRDSKATALCFRSGDAAYLAHRVLPSGTVLDILTDTSLLTNGRILTADAAALGLTLMGRHPNLVWLSVDPSLEDAQSGPTQDWIDPPWLGAMEGLVLWTVVVAMFWRGRRFGRLVVEPLPVVIKAIETTLSRGRLYHQTNARARALSALQGATARDLSRRLSLPPETPLPLLCQAAATAAGRDPAQIADLLTAPPSSDADLVTRAQQLATLEQEIRLR